MLRLCAPIALSLALLGCEQVHSDSVLTSGIYATYTVAHDGNGRSEVSGRLRVGGAGSNTYVELVGSDDLFADVGGERYRMSQQDGVFDQIRYHATLPIPGDDLEYVVALEREIDDGAPDSAVTMPSAFEVNDPGDEVSRATPLLLTWGPTSPDRINWVVVSQGQCQVEGDQITDDTGQVELTITANPGASTLDCEVTIRLVRERLGRLDAAYEEGGSITARQTRTVSFTATP